MFKNAKKLNFQRGFSLLEILLVLVVIGMASVGVMMAMPQHINKADDVDWQAQRFSTLLQFAEDEALISGKELAIVFKEDSYRFAFYDYQSKQWIAIESEQLGKVIEIPESIRFSYTLLGSVWDEIEIQDESSFFENEDLIEKNDDDKIESFSPQVFVMSSGEVTPFSLIFTEQDSSNKRSNLLEISMSGAITKTRSSEQ